MLVGANRKGQIGWTPMCSTHSWARYLDNLLRVEQGEDNSNIKQIFKGELMVRNYLDQNSRYQERCATLL